MSGELEDEDGIDGPWLERISAPLDREALRQLRQRDAERHGLELDTFSQVPRDGAGLFLLERKR